MFLSLRTIRKKNLLPCRHECLEMIKNRQDKTFGDLIEKPLYNVLLLGLGRTFFYNTSLIT